jgi:hypothetical protein
MERKGRGKEGKIPVHRGSAVRRGEGNSRVYDHLFGLWRAIMLDRFGVAVSFSLGCGYGLSRQIAWKSRVLAN